MKPIPPTGERTAGMYTNNTQHQAKSQIWSQGLGLGFLYYPWVLHCLYTQNAYRNPFHFVISQDIPDELLTLTSWLKILVHLLSPVLCSALGNSHFWYNSSELGSYSFVVSQIFCSTKRLSKHFTAYCICWTGYSIDLILLSLPIVSLRQILCAGTWKLKHPSYFETKVTADFQFQRFHKTLFLSSLLPVDIRGHAELKLTYNNMALEDRCLF